MYSQNLCFAFVIKEAEAEVFSYRDSVVGFTDDFTCLIRNASKQINPGINKGFDLLFKGDHPEL